MGVRSAKATAVCNNKDCEMLLMMMMMMGRRLRRKREGAKCQERSFLLIAMAGTRTRPISSHAMSGCLQQPEGRGCP